VTVDSTETVTLAPLNSSPAHRLGEWGATAICGKQTKRLRVAFVYEARSEIPPELAEDLAFLDEVYPEINVDFVAVRGVFGPELIERLSREWRIPKNYMFIGSPSGRFPYRISELGGVRLII
jgi:hypothetical protein